MRTKNIYQAFAQYTLDESSRGAFAIVTSLKLFYNRNLNTWSLFEVWMF